MLPPGPLKVDVVLLALEKAGAPVDPPIAVAPRTAADGLGRFD